MEFTLNDDQRSPRREIMQFAQHALDAGVVELDRIQRIDRELFEKRRDRTSALTSRAAGHPVYVAVGSALEAAIP